MSKNRLKEYLAYMNLSTKNNSLHEYGVLKLFIEATAIECDDRIKSDLLKQLIGSYSELAQKLNEKLEIVKRISVTDPLTGIFNRLKFNESVEEEIKKAKRFHHNLSLMIFDIDHFKKVNDQYGHDAGDKVLIKLCQIVNSCIETSDMFARWGGEEFVLMTMNSKADKTYDLAQRIRKQIEVSEFEEVKRITCSFGVTEMRADDDEHSLFIRVDTALYQAKENGRNQVVLL